MKRFIFIAFCGVVSFGSLRAQTLSVQVPTKKDSLSQKEMSDEKKRTDDITHKKQNENNLDKEKKSRHYANELYYEDKSTHKDSSYVHQDKSDLKAIRTDVHTTKSDLHKNEKAISQDDRTLNKDFHAIKKDSLEAVKEKK
ncbi:hypothetical protein [Taibaiella soli]|uniref:Uncharacterized protein n=1 Tax=Taibaiella soli TaxID=1649169 RepID=A0A2W2B339_9BACT|nr:hypothetical protein [Taibaiella soli]PZF74704.1 hypothetical protein DN068_00460 [Taibaiella soli]